MKPDKPLLKPLPAAAMSLAAVALIAGIAVDIAMASNYLTGLSELFSTVKRAYAFNTLWWPPFLVVAGLGAALLNRRSPRAARIPGWLALGVGLVLPAARLWATHIEPRMLQIRHVTIQTAKLKRPLTILHISDTQAPAVGSYERRAFAAMRELHPDLVIQTGDLVQAVAPATYAETFAQIEALAREIPAPLGRFIVDGDVDSELAQQMRRPGAAFHLLCDSNVEIELPEGAGRLRIRGLSLEKSHDPGNGLDPEWERWIAGGAPGDFTIAMGHAPDFALSAQGHPIDLCLAGHTHGGQVRLPFYGPLLTLSKVPRDWARGYREIGETRLNVSAGVGAEHLLDLPSIRVNCPPEMTVIRLEPLG